VVGARLLEDVSFAFLGDVAFEACEDIPIRPEAEETVNSALDVRRRVFTTVNRM
jgi:hypothetical protein